MMRKAAIALAAATAFAVSPAALAGGTHHGFSGGSGIGGHSMSVGGHAAHTGSSPSIGITGGRSMSLGVSRSISGGWSRPLGATGAVVTQPHTSALGQVYSGTRGIYRAQQNYGSLSGKYAHLGHQKSAYGYGKDHHHRHHHHRHGVVIIGGAYIDYGDDFGSYDFGESDSCWRRVRTDYGWQRVWVCGDDGND